MKELLEQGFDKQEGYDKYITNIVYSNNSYINYNNTKEVLYNYIKIFIKYGVNLNIESIFTSNLSDIDFFHDVKRYYESRGKLLDVISQVCKSSEYILNIETTFKYLSDVETNSDINKIIVDYLYITDFKKEINKYADWSNINATKYTIDMLVKNLNIDADTYNEYDYLPNDFKLKDIDIFKTIKYYSNYLRETFPNPNDDNSYI
jgi:ribosomal protein L30E